MKKIFLLLVCFVMLLRANPPLSLYNIDLTVRGQNYYTVFTQLSSAGYTQFPREIALQTMAQTPYLNAPYIVSGVIPYMQTLIPGPNYTLFLAIYTPQIATQTQFTVVGVEQLTDIIYYPNLPAIPTSPGYMANFLGNTLPLYNIDPVKRAEDIMNITQQLLYPTTSSNSVIKTAVSSSSQVWIQTNLTGPFYIPLVNGLIPYVQSISNKGSLLVITYFNPYYNPTVLGSITVSSEQIQQIVFYYNQPLRIP